MKRASGLVLLDQPAGAQEGGAVGQAAGLLHEVRHQHDRHFLPQLQQDVFDLHRRNRIDGDRELVQAEDLRAVGKGAGQRQPLLLPAGKPRAQQVQTVADLVPEHRLPETSLHQGVQFAAVVQAGPAGA